MTKKESTFSRSKIFSNWMRNNLPDSYSGFRIYDIDYILWKKGYEGKQIITDIMILEEKINDSDVMSDQRLLLQFINESVKLNCEKKGIRFHGTHLVRLETGDPETGKIQLDNKNINKEELKDKLSMVYKPIIRKYN